MSKYDPPVTTDGTVDEPVQNCPECLTPIPTVTISAPQLDAGANPDGTPWSTDPTPIWYEGADTGVTNLPGTGVGDHNGALGFGIIVLLAALVICALAVQMRRNGKQVLSTLEDGDEAYDL